MGPEGGGDGGIIFPQGILASEPREEIPCDSLSLSLSLGVWEVGELRGPPGALSARGANAELCLWRTLRELPSL